MTGKVIKDPMAVVMMSMGFTSIIAMVLFYIMGHVRGDNILHSSTVFLSMVFVPFINLLPILIVLRCFPSYQEFEGASTRVQYTCITLTFVTVFSNFYLVEYLYYNVFNHTKYLGWTPFDTILGKEVYHIATRDRKYLRTILVNHDGSDNDVVDYNKEIAVTGLPLETIVQVPKWDKSILVRITLLPDALKKYELPVDGLAKNLLTDMIREQLIELAKNFKPKNFDKPTFSLSADDIFGSKISDVKIKIFQDHQEELKKFLRDEIEKNDFKYGVFAKIEI